MKVRMLDGTGPITPEMAELIGAARLCFVATVNPDGSPNLSPKGSLKVLDAHHLAFANIASPTTVRNVRANGLIEINVVDVFSRRGFRFRGRAEHTNDADVLKVVAGANTADYPIDGAVRVAVASAHPVASPAYEFGNRSEQSLIDEFRAHYGAREPSFASLAFDDYPVPDFADVVIVAVPGIEPISADPADWARRVFAVDNAPKWVQALFAVRQSVVGLVGIQRGDASAFDVDVVRGSEALIRADESHLDFRCAVGIDVDRRLLRITTVVMLHGWRGRLYFAPVSILHGPVTRAMARRAARSQR
jgi:predicted pyridoxine 5'-phosphate oxidase superfamily flavin-nucleotide-binding protein